ncbi:tyrosine-type recombinase/integrase [Burkholderia multivorans]|uniref:tyrosine-type recombinase/integrase n=1 Tax=Burkholderia multivorans TaxID=87883 RepID=UPI000A9AFB76|nr:tyrosine-type recombinase/integrase [Burkholderia multivorans]
MVDLAYQTAQRIGDLLALNWRNVSEEGISFHPSKTVNSSGVRLLIEMTRNLRETLDRARGGKITAIGPVICTHAGGRFTYIGAYSAWKRACQRARWAYEKDCEERGITPNRLHLIGVHFHDLRAKALTEATAGSRGSASTSRPHNRKHDGALHEIAQSRMRPTVPLTRAS